MKLRTPDGHRHGGLGSHSCGPDGYVLSPAGVCGRRRAPLLTPLTGSSGSRPARAAINRLSDIDSVRRPFRLAGLKGLPLARGPFLYAASMPLNDKQAHRRRGASPSGSPAAAGNRDSSTCTLRITPRTVQVGLGLRTFRTKSCRTQTLMGLASTQGSAVSNIESRRCRHLGVLRPPLAGHHQLTNI